MSSPNPDKGEPAHHRPEPAPLTSDTLARVLDELRAPHDPLPPIGHHYSARSLGAAEREAQNPGA